MASYGEALERLVAGAYGAGLLDLKTAYLGGGTPTMLGPQELANLIACVHGCGQPGELTFEANPESLYDETIAAAVDAGATRVSIGVQSFNDRELRALGRVHDSVLARDRVSAAVVSGLRVSLDLMCGIPYQTEETWRPSLETAVSLGVGHVSCYPLMIEPGTAMERMCEAGELPWPSDDTEADDMETAALVLGAAGLSRYEVASYAQPGERCRHNIAYWTGVEYLGLGTSAASMLGRGSYVRLHELVPSLPDLADDTERARLTITSSTREIVEATSLARLRFEVEELNAREAVAEDLMLAARMADGIGERLLARARRVLGAVAVDERIAKLVKLGFLERAGSAYAPTKQGWLLGNELYGPLWDFASE